MVLGRTHAVFGLFLALLVQASMVEALLCILGAVFPDIDHPKSLLGRHVKPLRFFVKHRGITHSLLALITISAALFFASTYTKITLFAAVLFAAGYASHLILDGITKEGITPLYPKKWRIVGVVRVGGFLETLFLILLLLGVGKLIL